MDELDDLLASMRSGKTGDKRGPAKAKKNPPSVSPDGGSGKEKASRVPADRGRDVHVRGTPAPAQAPANGAQNRKGAGANRAPADVPPDRHRAEVKPLPRTTERQAPIGAAESAKRLFGHHDKVQTGYKGNMPKPFELLPRLAEHLPTKFKTGDLKVGDSVWYRGHERYWLIDVQPFEKTSYVRVSSIAVRPGGNLPKDAEIFWVHVDLLELAPIKGPTFTPQPTRHAVDTKEKMKAEGTTDIGDQIATMLRGKTLDESYAVCSKFIRIPEDELRAKYRKLNPGQQRMNLGNRMRGFAKKNGV